MAFTLRLYIAPDEEAEAIADDVYVAPRGSAMTLPGDLEEGDLGTLYSLLAKRSIDPYLSVATDLLAEGGKRWAFVHRVLPDFMERLAALGEDRFRAVAARWSRFLNEGQDEREWSPDKAQRALRRLSAFARRARSRELSVLLASEGP